jgi:hypothetical protein
MELHGSVSANRQRLARLSDPLVRHSAFSVMLSNKTGCVNRRPVDRWSYLYPDKPVGLAVSCVTALISQISYYFL